MFYFNSELKLVDFGTAKIVRTKIISNDEDFD